MLYWCHACQVQFESQRSEVCPICGSELVEEVLEGQEHPRNFLPEMPSFPLHVVLITYLRGLPVYIILVRFRVSESRGATEEMINKCPIVPLESVPSEFRECSICQENLDRNSRILMLPCTHVFHRDCIVHWLRVHNNCPVCRFPLQM